MCDSIGLTVHCNAALARRLESVSRLSPDRLANAHGQWWTFARFGYELF
jgi:hypothetical protein